MTHQNIPVWVWLGSVALILLVAVAVIWVVAPEETRGGFLLVAGAATAALYGALYAGQRRRHW